jgi:hypothetical protein
VEYLWTKDPGWQVVSEWLYLGREPVLRLEKGVVHALVRDHLGSVRADVWVDEDGQPVIQRADYWPYGEAIAPTLSPSEGHRFTAPDPIGSSWNAYAYVLGNPVNLVDPWGVEDENSGGRDDTPLNLCLCTSPGRKSGADTLPRRYRRRWRG